MILILTGSLVLLVVVALGLGALRNRSIRQKIERGELQEFPDIKQIEDMECCGQHQTCEKESLLAAVSRQIEYYDDEELDTYRGVASDAYTPEQVEQFRDVLYTMQEVEVAGWVRSLQLRGIELPDEVKDEVFLIVGERRMS
ncbi:MAG: phospholipase [Bacteroidaceae bacterium]|nr:phospholipase [Bacteroidaceae bacterium]MBQ6799984.1 phospholipase [Bacteroidaceae bacterium]MBQ8191614.1 phospholipase [Bacteroidaceae bacterium]MBR6590333.1 phospholipase [Bacteroidaceae bacterium]